MEGKVTYRYSVGELFPTSSGWDARPIDFEVLHDPEGIAEYPQEYDIFAIDIGDENIIYFGLGGDATTPDQRPTDLDFENYSVRIQ